MQALYFWRRRLQIKLNHFKSCQRQVYRKRGKPGKPRKQFWGYLVIGGRVLSHASPTHICRFSQQTRISEQIQSKLVNVLAIIPAAIELWIAREVRVLYSIGNCFLGMKVTTKYAVLHSKWLSHLKSPKTQSRGPYATLML